jgi:DUF1365 family protein
MVVENCFYIGHVMHKRDGALRHIFKYRTFSCLLNLDAIDSLTKEIPWFSRNRFNLMSFYDKDHGGRNGSDTKQWLVNILQEKTKINYSDCTIYILSMPRLLGYVFNPLSVYFIYHKNKSIQAIVYEVKNTDKQQHCYAHIIPENQRNSPILRHESNKGFYVSPFLPLEGTYAFTLRQPNERCAVAITYTHPEHRLIATQSGVKHPFSARNVLKFSIHYAFMTLKIIGGIYMEAIRLRLKGAKFHRVPPPPSEPITVSTPEV